MTASTGSYERGSTRSAPFDDIYFSILTTWYCLRCGPSTRGGLTLETGALVCMKCGAYSPDVGPRVLNEFSETYMGRMMRAWVIKERKRLKKERS